MARQTVPTLSTARQALPTVALTRMSVLTLALLRAAVLTIDETRLGVREVAQGRMTVVTTEAPSGVVVLPPVSVTPPVASGVVRIGETLTSGDGVWTNSPTGYSYQWTRNSVPITGEITNSYVTVAADIGALIACEVTATNAGGSSAPEPSNDLSSPWRPILLAHPGVLIFDSADPYCYGGAGVGAPVTNVYTVDGVLIGTQALSGSRPTRLTNGLSFDGLDDHLIGNAHANLVEQAHTMIWGFDAPEDTTTAVRTLFCASSNTSGASSQQVSVNYSRPGAPNATRQRYAIGDATFVTVSLAGYSIGAGPYNLLLRAGTPGNTFRSQILDGSLTAISSGTRGANDAIDFDWMYIGVRAIGATPTLAQYWQGRLRHFAIDDANWSDADALLYRTCAIAAGVM